jgi:hypothetical protein
VCVSRNIWLAAAVAFKFRGAVFAGNAVSVSVGGPVLSRSRAPVAKVAHLAGWRYRWGSRRRPQSEKCRCDLARTHSNVDKCHGPATAAAGEHIDLKSAL